MSVDSILNDMLNNFSEAQMPDVLLLRQVIATTEEVMALVLGVLVWGLVVGVFVITAFDLMYLNLPNTRQSLEDLNNVSKIRFISQDAINALAQGYMQDGKSPTRLYGTKRVKTYLLTCLIIVIMVTGTWDVILDFLIGIASILIAWIWTVI